MSNIWERILSTLYGAISLLAAAAIWLVWESNRTGRALYGAKGVSFYSLWKVWLLLLVLSIALFAGNRAAQGVFIILSEAFGGWMLIASISSSFPYTLDEIAWGTVFLVPSALTIMMWRKQRLRLQHGT